MKPAIDERLLQPTLSRRTNPLLLKKSPAAGHGYCLSTDRELEIVDLFTPYQFYSILPVNKHKMPSAIRREEYSDKALWISADFIRRSS